MRRAVASPACPANELHGQVVGGAERRSCRDRPVGDDHPVRFELNRRVASREGRCEQPGCRRPPAVQHCGFGEQERPATSRRQPAPTSGEPLDQPQLGSQPGQDRVEIGPGHEIEPGHDEKVAAGRCGRRGDHDTPGGGDRTIGPGHEDARLERLGSARRVGHPIGHEQQVVDRQGAHAEAARVGQYAHPKRIGR